MDEQERIEDLKYSVLRAAAWKQHCMSPFKEHIMISGRVILRSVCEKCGKVADIFPQENTNESCQGQAITDICEGLNNSQVIK